MLMPSIVEAFAARNDGLWRRNFAEVFLNMLT
jgi:hypothetical protein